MGKLFPVAVVGYNINLEKFIYPYTENIVDLEEDEGDTIQRRYEYLKF